MSLTDKKLSDIARDLKTITAHQTDVAKHHAQCLVDGAKFKRTLDYLAKHNPQALKELIDNDREIEVKVYGGQITGYWSGSYHRYVDDSNLSSFISSQTDRRISNCDGQSR